MNKSVVLFSGGIDSTVCLAWAINQYKTVYALGIDYGQSHRIELTQAQTIAGALSVPFEVVSVADALRGGTLLGEKKRPGRFKNLNPAFVPGRNALMLTIAASYGYSRGAFGLVIGANQEDYLGFPDCRPAFFRSMEKMLELATERVFRIERPIIDKDKAGIFRMAEELGVLNVALEHSHTGYDGKREHQNEWGWGTPEDPANKIRADGFARYRASK